MTTLEDWAAAYIETTSLAHKTAPPPLPREFAATAAPRRIHTPGRPPELDLIGKTRRSVPREQLHNPRRRAQLIHTFWHHELQAAELMCWAVLAFPDTPVAFRRGLLGVCQDEIRHMGLYREHLRRLDHELGDFPVRDWFWTRTTTCTNPRQFVALMGMGFEGGNLDHTKRFAAWFAEVGDQAGAELQQLVGDEEVAHVKFALRWFREWSDGVDDEFDDWCRTLVEPLTPALMRGKNLDHERRGAAGFDATFLDRLEGFGA